MDPARGEQVDISISTFADDVARTHLVSTAAAFTPTVQQMDAGLDQSFARDGMAKIIAVPSRCLVDWTCSTMLPPTPTTSTPELVELVMWHRPLVQGGHPPPTIDYSL